MQIIKDRKIVDDRWTHVADDAPLNGAHATVSAARWRAERDSLAERGDIGLRLGGADEVADFAEDLARIPLIVLEFAQMADGRLFSSARLLRERYGYAGELRARGDFIRDQMFFLSRVGVNAFEFSHSSQAEAALASLGDFTVRYQAATDERTPLYRRRMQD